MTTYKVLVNLRQRNPNVMFLEKEVEYPVIPVPDSYLEYEDGWGVACIQPVNESGLHLYVSRDGLSVSGYGPQFTEDEIMQLENLGWTVHRNK